jgi:hypothetical protein
MSKTFDRIVALHIKGEVYDSYTTPENIINNYDWTFDDNVDGNIQLFAHHNDDRGRILEVNKLPQIYKLRTTLIKN